MTYSEEGLYFISEQLFNDLETVGAIGDTNKEERSRLIDLTAETFKMTLDKIENNSEILKEGKLFHTAATVMYRTLETMGVTIYVNEEARDAVIGFIEFIVKTRCESSQRAKELFERCKQLMSKQET